MTLAEEYRRQLPWRSWSAVFDALPSLEGRSVWDLGCAVGDQAAELVARGAHVTGLDLNEELHAEARARGLPNADFRKADLRRLPEPDQPLDGIWSSFAAAYFPDLPEILGRWRNHLRAGGWIALTEVDDLFGHAPLDPRSTMLLESYAQEALLAGRYDFQMGRKLAGHLRESGFRVEKTLILDDQEFSFGGPARPEVALAWEARLDRMTLLQGHCGPEFDHVRSALLDCFRSADHASASKVYCCLATASP